VSVAAPQAFFASRRVASSMWSVFFIHLILPYRYSSISHTRIFGKSYFTESEKIVTLKSITYGKSSKPSASRHDISLAMATPAQLAANRANALRSTGGLLEVFDPVLYFVNADELPGRLATPAGEP